MAFERLLARLFTPTSPPWVLKDGYVLEVRFDNWARATLDLDLMLPDPVSWAQEVGADAQAPWTAFSYEHLQQAGAPGGGLRCAVETRLAGRTFARFHLDLGLGDALATPPEWMQLHSLLAFAGIAAPRIALYLLEQQLAEKIHAYTFPWRDRENTRVKDLADLVLLIASGMLDAARVRAALHATFSMRGTHPLPTNYRPPRQGGPMPTRRWRRSLRYRRQRWTKPMCWCAITGKNRNSANSSSGKAAELRAPVRPSFHSAASR